MTPRPTDLKLAEDGALEILWSDGVRHRYGVKELREACPCATCREKRAEPRKKTLLPVLAPEEARPLAITGMKPVGNYAYNVAFSDGHDTGIFTLELLRQLGSEA